MNKELNMMMMMMMMMTTTMMMMMMMMMMMTKPTKMTVMIRMLQKQKTYFQLQAVRKLELSKIQEYGHVSYIHNSLFLM
jgi:hypothetical protein